MADDNTINIDINVSSKKLDSELSKSSNSVKKTTNEIKSDFSSLNASMETLSKNIPSVFNKNIDEMMKSAKNFSTGIALYLAGTGIKNAIDEQIKYGDSVKDLSESLGISAEEASKLKVQLSLVGLTSEDYIGANFRLMAQLKNNREELKKYGVDVSGSQKEIFESAIKTMMTYREGIDRNSFAMLTFGKGAAEAQKFAELNNDTMTRAANIAAKYGMVMDEDMIKKTKAYKLQVNELSIVKQALSVKIGTTLMP